MDPRRGDKEAQVQKQRVNGKIFGEEFRFVMHRMHDPLSLCRGRAGHPLEAVSVGDVVDVKVLDVDVAKKRISLTMRLDQEAKPKDRQKK